MIKLTVFATCLLMLLGGPAYAQPAGFVRLDSPACCRTTKLLAADVNGDTRVDLIAGTETGLIGDGDHTISVLRGRGDGRFTFSAGYFIGLASGDPYIKDMFVGDVNGDTRPDIVALLFDPDTSCDPSLVCSPDESHVAVLLGQVGGTFSAPIRRFLPFAEVAGAGDVNNDGRLDLVVNDTARRGGFRVLLGASDGTFRLSLASPPVSPDTRIEFSAIGLADISGDGTSDVVFYEHLNADNGGGSPQLAIFRGNGDGTFALSEPTVTVAPPGLNGRLAFADINGDRSQDIVAADRGVWVFYNFAGFLSPMMFLSGRDTRDLLVGDVNRDGLPDIPSYVVTPDNDWSVISSDGSGGLASPALFPLGSDTVAALGDFNRDGRLDVATIHRTSGSVASFLNHPPDLEISKTQVGEFFAGGTGTYALNVRNIGPGATVEPGGLTVRDILPPSLTYVSATGPGWACEAEGPEVECRRVSELPSGDETKIVLVVAIAPKAPAVVLNTATASTNGDYNPANDAAANSARIRRPDLALTKTVDASLFSVGASYTYTLTVRNVGDADAGLFGQTTIVTDPLPRGLTLVAADGCTLRGSLVACPVIGPLAPGSIAVFRLKVRVGFEVGGGIVMNSATVSQPADINAANDSASVSRLVQVEPALAINLLQENVSLLPINQGLKRALSAPLTGALAALERQQPRVAVLNLQAFQLVAGTLGVTGKIKEADAAALIGGAQITIAAIIRK